MAKTDVERAWELMNLIKFCMFSTRDGEWLHSRPMGAFVREAEGAVYFFSNDRSNKSEEIRRCPKVSLTFSDIRRQKYLSASGTAEFSHDPKKLQELWALPAKVWWKSKTNPDLCLIKVSIEQAEYWDSPGNFVSNLDLLLALVTRSYPRAGEYKKVIFESSPKHR